MVASERCLLFRQPGAPGKPEHVPGKEEPGLGPVRDVGLLQLHLGLVLQSRVLRCWPVQGGQQLADSFGCPKWPSSAHPRWRLSEKPSHPFSQLDGRHRRGRITLSSSCGLTYWWWWCCEASQLRLPAQHRGAHTHMTYSSAAPTKTTTIKPLFYILNLLMLTMVTPATPCISWWS